MLEQFLACALNGGFLRRTSSRAFLDATPSRLSYSLQMKFDVLRSIGHNIADSLASGESMLTGQYEIDPFAEANRGPNGSIHVNFLTGTSNSLSPVFERGVALFGEALPELNDPLISLWWSPG